MWKRLFGADLSPELVAALAFVDVTERIARLTSGGWVRDADDRIYASGADPEVVAMLVEAASAKGWSSVCLWGPPEFIAEASRRFEAAGISVTAGDAPPAAYAQPQVPSLTPKLSAAEVLAKLRRRVEAAEAHLAVVRRPGEAPASLAEAQDAERAASDAVREASARENDARQALVAAEYAANQASFFRRAAARRALAVASAANDAAEAAYRDAFERCATAKRRIKDITAAFDRREKSRRAQFADVEARAEATLAFERECERVAMESPELAARGIPAVRDAVKVRLSRESPGSPEQTDRQGEPECDDTTASPTP